MLKKILATIAAIGLAVGALLGVAAPALAADETPVEITTEIAAADEGTIPPVDAAVPLEEFVPEEEQPPDQPSTLRATTVVSAPAVQATDKKDKDDKKVYVCKFVASANSPGGYRLQTGQNPIHVSVNALGDDVNDTGTFKDAQPSFIVAADDVSLCTHTTVVTDSRVSCPAAGDSGIVNLTITTTLFYGSTQVGDPVVTHDTRALTADELAACPVDKKVWVCKFVASANAPHGYVLKDGKNPIHVSVNALGDDVNDTGTFQDAQPSFVVDSEDAKCVDVVVVVEEGDVVCPTDEVDGFVEVTTTTTTKYGTSVVDVTVVETTRALTAGELATCGQLPDLGLVLPKVTSAPIGCFADGSYTLGAAAGYDSTHVMWTVNGVPNVASGTYAVTSATIVTVVAQPVAPHGLEPEWANPAPLVFTQPANCDLPTLALTGGGVDAGPGLSLAGGLLFLGLSALYVRRRSGQSAE